MKIAVVTDDGDYVSQHFGRSRYYKIYTVENGEYLHTEMRPRTIGHHGYQPPVSGEHEEEDHSRGHGYGADARAKHQLMAQQIADCDVLIAGGMGRGAYEQFRQAGLEVVLTDYESVEEAVTAYVEGKIRNLADERTD